MKLVNSFILESPNYLKPSYRISPFKTDDISVNKNLSVIDKDDFDIYLKNRFTDRKYLYTEDGRSAIGSALQVLNLQKDDVVSIFTTTNNNYISGCVSSKIEEYCLWSRKIEKNTKAILVNHEFGYCAEDMQYYKSLGFPIIEDFAHSFESHNSIRNSGLFGDFLIFSLSKYFTIQTGGILVYNTKYTFQNKYIDKELQSYISNIISNYIDNIYEINNKRLRNYQIYVNLFKTIDIKPYFYLNKNNVPAVFCFNTPKNIDLNQMKKYLNDNGIESSVFYGSNAYFIPNHQKLDENDIEFIFTVVKNFIG